MYIISSDVLVPAGINAVHIDKEPQLPPPHPTSVHFKRLLYTICYFYFILQCLKDSLGEFL